MPIDSVRKCKLAKFSSAYCQRYACFALCLLPAGAYAQDAWAIFRSSVSCAVPVANRCLTRRRMTCLSMFWHFLDVIWIGVFTFVYLMGMI